MAKARLYVVLVSAAISVWIGIGVIHSVTNMLANMPKVPS